MNFADFCRAHGVFPRDTDPSAKVRRCPTAAHPKSTNGAYFYDGRRGWVMAWDGSGDLIWWNDEAAPQFDADLHRRHEQDRRADEDRRRLEAAQKAQSLLDAAAVAPSPYLKFKGLPEALAQVVDRMTVVPMRDSSSGQLVGAQTIAWNADTREHVKKFLYGTRAKGAVLRMGRSAEAYFCEGFATAHSIAAALSRMQIPAQVVCCFSAGNLTHVARTHKGRGYVIADNDASRTGEAAAQASGLPYAMPDEVGTDANDLHCTAGVLEVVRLLQEVRRR